MLKYGLLGLLNYNDMSGYEITKAFEKSVGFFWTVTMSQVYRELTAMEKNGWLNSSQVIQNGKPNKKVYNITELGKNEFTKWLSTYNGESFFIKRNSFLVNLFFGGERTIHENIKILKRFKEDCLGFVSSISKTDESISEYSEVVNNDVHSVYWEIVADLGRSSIVETVKWIERSIDKLEKLL